MQAHVREQSIEMQLANLQRSRRLVRLPAYAWPGCRLDILQHHGSERQLLFELCHDASLGLPAAPRGWRKARRSLQTIGEPCGSSPLTEPTRTPHRPTGPARVLDMGRGL